MVSIDKNMRFNLNQAFEAWQLGLYRLFTNRVPRYVKIDSMNWWETYNEVTEVLNDEQIRY